MKKMFYALITLCIITVMAIPQNANAYSPQSHIHLLSTDIGSHQTLTVVNFEPQNFTPITNATAAIPHEADLLPIRLRTTPKITRQSQYFNSNTRALSCYSINRYWQSQNKDNNI